MALQFGFAAHDSLHLVWLLHVASNGVSALKWHSNCRPYGNDLLAALHAFSSYSHWASVLFAHCLSSSSCAPHDITAELRPALLHFPATHQHPSLPMHSSSFVAFGHAINLSTTHRCVSGSNSHPVVASQTVGVDLLHALSPVGGLRSMHSVFHMQFRPNWQSVAVRLAHSAGGATQQGVIASHAMFLS